MYKPPIEILMSDIEYQLIQQAEDMLFRAARGCGVNVDRHRLISALRHDREQYEKGYQDAKKDMSTYARWDKPSEHGLPYKTNTLGVVCSRCCSWSDNKYNYCPNCGARMDVERSSDGEENKSQENPSKSKGR